MSCQCLGSKLRQDLKKKLTEAREISGQKLDYSKKIMVTLGGGREEEFTLKDLTERERHSPEWAAVAAGGTRAIPVTEFRLKNLPKPKSGEVDFQLKKATQALLEH